MKITGSITGTSASSAWSMRNWTMDWRCRFCRCCHRACGPVSDRMRTRRSTGRGNEVRRFRRLPQIFRTIHPPGAAGIRTNRSAICVNLRHLPSAFRFSNSMPHLHPRTRRPPHGTVMCRRSCCRAPAGGLSSTRTVSMSPSSAGVTVHVATRGSPGGTATHVVSAVLRSMR